ncbi:hypothetical protein OFN54_39855, partial [Escherichia coli]|nr:hypothetical protein [Escherichia coli]
KIATPINLSSCFTNCFFITAPNLNGCLPMIETQLRYRPLIQFEQKTGKQLANEVILRPSSRLVLIHHLQVTMY